MFTSNFMGEADPEDVPADLGAVPSNAQGEVEGEDCGGISYGTSLVWPSGLPPSGVLYDNLEPSTNQDKGVVPVDLG